MSFNLVEINFLCGQLDRREIDRTQFVHDCTRLIADAIGCSRAGIWLFEDTFEGRILRCLGIFDRVKGRVTFAPDERDSRVGAYFDALERTGHVVAPDARTHPATAGIFADHLDTSVRSVLASAFSVNGELFGAFTCTQVNETAHWTPGQLAILKRIGARASLALAGSSRTSLPTLPMPL